ncbi:MAG: DUF4878 domain-containing protein [Acidobacteria bacterium]|nr:DUF4878 domain-containing protein [Acidobacteriota bacterium]
MKAKASLTMALLLTLLSGVSCSRFFSSPTSVVRNLMGDITAGKIDDAAALLSSNYIQSKGGMVSVKQKLADVAWVVKEKKNLKSFEVQTEEVFGDLASVTASVVSSDGITRTIKFKLVKENGAWKIDSVEPDFL